MSRGQSLVELAICAPVVTLLALGTVTVGQVADARAGLEAATQAAVAAAARAPDATSAQLAAQRGFRAMLTAHRLSGARLTINLGSFQRGGTLVGESSATVDVGWAAMVGLPRHVDLRASAETRVELWRSRQALA